jgi:hypothetical protein
VRSSKIFGRERGEVGHGSIRGCEVGEQTSEARQGSCQAGPLVVRVCSRQTILTDSMEGWFSNIAPSSSSITIIAW